MMVAILKRIEIMQKKLASLTNRFNEDSSWKKFCFTVRETKTKPFN